VRESYVSYLAVPSTCFGELHFKLTTKMLAFEIPTN
jgi:hypothetical protein